MVVFGTSRSTIIESPDFLLTVNGVALSPDRKCKNLGLFIDSDLRFSDHVSSLIQKTFGKLKLLYIHRDALDVDTKLRLTDSLILSHLNYCDVVYWPALLQKDRDSLQKIQHACLRFIYNVRKFDHITPSLNNSKWLTLEERFQLHLSRLVYRIRDSGLPKYLSDKLVKHSDIHDRLTRHKDLYSVPKYSHSFFTRCFSYTSASAFNSLPDDVKKAQNSEVFANKLKKLILSNRNPH